MSMSTLVTHDINNSVAVGKSPCGAQRKIDTVGLEVNLCNSKQIVVVAVVDQ